jgi:DNA-binding CsgD family transcriptional regulator
LPNRLRCRWLYREKRIVRRFVCGESPAEIALHFGNTVSTINDNLHTATRKAGLQHRGQLPLYVAQNPRVIQEGGDGVRGLHLPNMTCLCFGCCIMRGDVPRAA